ncbi:hypothetical protein D3C87_2074720 [compost metagenome]
MEEMLATVETGVSMLDTLARLETLDPTMSVATTTVVETGELVLAQLSDSKLCQVFVEL